MTPDKENISQLTIEKLKGFNGFLVDVIVSPGNKFVVEIDTPEGVSILQCEEVNRFLNKELDNETNEFDLTVSSPGLERPFKVHEQYVKNINREIKVRTTEGKECSGVLKAVNKSGIQLMQRVKEIPQGKKKKEWIEQTIDLNFEKIKDAKIILNFK